MTTQPLINNTLSQKAKKDISTSEKIILGIDPGLTVTGFGVVKGEKRPEVVSAGEIKPIPNKSIPQKLGIIFHRIEEVVRETSPDAVAVEGIFYAKNVKNAIKLGHARGVILLAAARADVPVFEYSPREVKMAATGYGGAEKSQVEMMIMEILNLNKGEIGNHACDALAVALCHLHTSGPLDIREGL